MDDISKKEAHEIPVVDENGRVRRFLRIEETKGGGVRVHSRKWREGDPTDVVELQGRDYQTTLDIIGM